MRLIQFLDRGDTIRVAVSEGESTAALPGFHTVYELASEAIEAGLSLKALIDERFPNRESMDYKALIAAQAILSPVTHPDPAHMLLTGTGLTHLGSADTRDRMHGVGAQGETLTDSMKMFRWGIEGGKPSKGEAGVQPEWFYKGDGSMLVPPFQAIESPSFALDHGEEPEIVGIYLIDREGNPWRLGFALANEFSDHITERQNYLYLAHSKLRNCSIGPELRLGPLPDIVRGNTRILRSGACIWEKSFLSGEANMSHSIANLEYHHFKYQAFRRPGDLHVHFLGTATLSFADGIRISDGDIVEISSNDFGEALSNPVKIAEAGSWELRSL